LFTSIQVAEEIEDLIAQMNDLKVLEAETYKEAKTLRDLLDAKLKSVGNLVHDSVPISDDEVKITTLELFLSLPIFIVHSQVPTGSEKKYFFLCH
jgi:seryl-tRNA synthetase